MTYFDPRGVRHKIALERIHVALHDRRSEVFWPRVMLPPRRVLKHIYRRARRAVSSSLLAFAMLPFLATIPRPVDGETRFAPMGFLISVLAVHARAGVSIGGGGGGSGDWEAGQTDNGASLPTTKMDTTINWAAQTGTVHTVTSLAEFQTALTAQASQDNPVIKVTANIDVGATSLTLPNRTGAGSCYICTDYEYQRVNGGGTAFAKAPGQRVAAADATTMRQLRATSGNVAVFNAAVQASPGHHYRIIGFELTATTTQQGGLVTIGGSNSGTAANYPHHITIDRCYMWGTPGTTNIRRGVHLNGANNAVIDCAILGMRDSGATESQAILVIHGPGPLKVTNNRLQALGENMMIGGDAMTLTPSDIEIRFNYMDVDAASWEGVYAMKNNFEIKYGQRILFEGNHTKESWTSGQTGEALVMKRGDSNSGVGGSQYIALDIVVRHNFFENAQAPFGILASQGADGGENDVMERTVVRDNVWKTNRSSLGRFGIQADETVGRQWGGHIDLKVLNNVIECRESASACYMEGRASGPLGSGFVFNNNIFPTGSNGPLHADGDGDAVSVLNAMYSSYTVQGNAVRGTWNVAGGFITGNTAATTTTWRLCFTDYANNDFSIATGNWAEGVGTGGSNPGLLDPTDWTSRLQYTVGGQRPAEI